MKEFPSRQYQLIEKLKQSSGSSTFVAKPHFGNESPVILKIYTGTISNSSFHTVEENLRWQRGLVHPHLLGINSAGISGKNSIFTTRSHLKDEFDLSTADPSHIVQLLDAVSFLHRHGRVHGSIKPSNLFIAEGTVRLADMMVEDSREAFGLDRIRYTAPEVLLGQKHTLESDYYSVGAILYRIYARRDPFEDAIPENLREKYLQARIPTIRHLSGIRDQLAKAIEGLLHRNPRNRTRAYEVLIAEMPFAPEFASRAPMVGRREAFDRIYARVSSRTARTLTVDLIEGDAGIGKSRFVEELEFKSKFNNSEFYRSSCSERTEPSLAPVSGLIRTVLLQQCREKRVGIRSFLGTFETNLAPLFGDEIVEHLRDGVDHPNERVVQDLIGLIGVLSRKDSLKLCIEDIDRAEPAIQSFIRQLCLRASELNVRLILTCRHSALSETAGEIGALLGPAFSRLSLEPLTRAEAYELVRYLESSSRKQQLAWSRAGGNPLWLCEQARSESSQRLVDSVHTLLREEKDPNIRKLAHVLAISRGPSSAELLSKVISVDLESVRKNLSRLRQIGAVHEVNLGYVIRMEGLRSAIESEIAPRRKRMIHESTYKALLSEKCVSEERLAEHAFYGAIWDRASIHITSLAQLSVKRGDHVSVLRLYGRLKRVFRKLNQKLPIEVEIGTALALAKIGNARKAALVYKRFLSESQINEDVRLRISLLFSGAEIDRSNLALRLRFLQEVLESPARKQLHAAILLSQLSTTFVGVGDFTNAVDALKRAREALEQSPDLEGRKSLAIAEGFLLANTGQFRAALETYETLTQGNWGLAAAALTNQAFCLEQLGKLRSAVINQKRALRLATKAGLLVGQYLCLANLGDFNTRLGNLSESRECFGKMKLLPSQMGPNVGVSFKGGEVEEAFLEFVEGRYGAAIQHLRSGLNSSSLMRYTRFQSRFLESEITFSLGVGVKESDVDQLAKEGLASESPLHAVQLALLRSRTKTVLSEALAVLKDALETAGKASLLYETCRLELEIADRMHETDPNGAKPHAVEALRISKKNGYRPLQCRALLLRALCSSHEKERGHYLGLSYKLATAVGIPEIVSESSYHLGVLYESKDQIIAARECFANSTRVTSELADQVPAKYRSSYLARPWRKDARKRYERRLLEQPIKLPAAESAPSSRDHRYFRALYRISIAAASCRSADEFIKELLPAVGFSRDSTVAMLIREGNTAWFSHGVALTDTLRHRILSVSVKARDHARFDSTDRWIPIRSLNYSGGICVLTRKRTQMDEEEMEFFTILGVFVSSALDQIYNRVVSNPVTVSATDFHGIIGNSRPIRELCAHISKISNSGATVLIQGETGTGKELVARAIHKLSERSRAPFVAVDCGAISESLLESELFGSKRGSFTGAIADRPGVFEAAHTGTLFLDEISNMNHSMQAKLLRVLQEREIRRVGETRSRPIDVRLIAASNTNLKQLVSDGAFRQDLLFRLNVIGVTTPPLRDRREDIPVLASYFLKQLNSTQKTGKAFGPGALDALLTHSFPGNVRELQNSVERAFFTASGRTILSIPIDTSSGDESINEVRKWLADLAEGRRNFWTEIRDRYKRRDISREKVVALIDLGLRSTHGSYKNLASLLRIDQGDYRRLMDFLRRNNCLLDFRPYRKVASLS
jgi:DNA-binding NtrC family response regulator/tetratricopeptide (TPR) repeat protein